MVKHPLAWALVITTSLGAVYGMSNAATEADVALTTSSEISTITPPPQKPVRTESGLDYFRFRSGYLEWKLQHIYSEYEMEKEKFNIKCYGRTHFYDTDRKTFIEEVNDEFSGRLSMPDEDENGYAQGQVRITLRPTQMRYTLLCGWFQRMIEVTPRDWPSNIYNKEFKSLNQGSVRRSAQLSDIKNNKQVKTTKPVTDEFVSIAKAGGKTTNKLIPGAKKALVAAFVVDAKKKMRIKAITLSSPKWFVKSGVLKHLSITLDGKQPDSKDVFSEKKTLHWTGLGDYGLFETVMPGKHLIEIKASIINPKDAKAFSDTFSVSGINGITGTGLKLKLKNPIKLQTYTVPYDKKRTKAEDENLGP